MLPRGLAKCSREGVARTGCEVPAYAAQKASKQENKFWNAEEEEGSPHQKKVGSSRNRLQSNVEEMVLAGDATRWLALKAREDMTYL